jgi:hypothetical protein
MKIIGRLFWVTLALVAGVYAVVIGGAYLICSPFIWLIWWIISGKSFPISKILFNILAPTLIVFDQLEKISNPKNN